MLHVYLSKFCVENDARDENFKKQLLSEIIMFFLSANSNVPLIKKPNSTCVKSHILNVAFSLKNSSNVLIVIIVVSIDKFTRARQKKNHNAKHKEHSLIENPIKPFSVCDLRI